MTTFRPLPRRCALALGAIALAASGLAAHAQTTVQEPWVRGTVPGQQASGAFMRLTSAQGGRLVAAASPVAATVEVHEMKMADGVMRMAAVPALDLPPGQVVELKPGGYHIMLMGLKQTLKAGEPVPLTLTVEGRDGKRETLELKADVRALGAAPAPHGHTGH
ncbi:copper chaperone PCu(A)C [Ideonella sp.]|uniref:copper chaperone PCu(A)C n=1 Tax=Ideonella sp. TaxID=1929293 RepID=UPI0035AF58EE